MDKELFIEIVTERVAEGPAGIIASTARKATEEEISKAKIAHNTKSDPHLDEKETVFYDEAGFLYEIRKCGICGEIIAAI